MAIGASDRDKDFAPPGDLCFGSRVVEVFDEERERLRLLGGELRVGCSVPVREHAVGEAVLLRHRYAHLRRQCIANELLDAGYLSLPSEATQALSVDEVGATAYAVSVGVGGIGRGEDVVLCKAFDQPKTEGRGCLAGFEHVVPGVVLRPRPAECGELVENRPAFVDCELAVVETAKAHDVDVDGSGTADHGVEVAGAAAVTVEVGSEAFCDRHVAIEQPSTFDPARDLPVFDRTRSTRNTGRGNGRIRGQQASRGLVAAAEGLEEREHIVSVRLAKRGVEIVRGLTLSAVGEDRVVERVGASVVQVWRGGGHAPKRLGAELGSTGELHRDAVCKVPAHVVQQEVGIQRDHAPRTAERRRVTRSAAKVGR